eukprot:942594-Rhodomonas_salina.5
MFALTGEVRDSERGEADALESEGLRVTTLRWREEALRTDLRSTRGGSSYLWKAAREGGCWKRASNSVRRC